MKNFNKIILLGGLALCLAFSDSIAVSGPNQFAEIRFDLNATTSGNQNLTSIPPPSVNQYIRVDIYAINAVNLDTYEFELIYNNTQLAFVSASPDNPVTFEPNFLTTLGGTAIGFMVSTPSPGVLSVAYTLTGSNPAQAPSGQGLLASVVFKALTTAQGKLTFGNVFYVDSYGVRDIITNKGQAFLPVELSSFTATPDDGVITLNWRTQTETNFYGWDVYRGESENGEYIKVNDSVILGQGTTVVPHDYSYADDTVTNIVTYYYKLKQIDQDGSFTWSSIVHATAGLTSVQVPTVYSLSQNYPNPFNPECTIKFQLPKNCFVTLKIYNIQGREVATLVKGDKKAGYYSITWNGRDKNGALAANGTYLYVLETDGFKMTKKMSLLK